MTQLYGLDLEARRPAVNGGPAPPPCAFTVDVEDWYQSTVDFDAEISDRVPRNVDRVLAVLNDYGIKGTFFVQGRVAQAFPAMLRMLLDEGHEIQSHAHTHRPLYAMDRAALHTELEFAVKTVEDACGVRVTAFRAPDFSIVPENLWALEVLAEHGFEVDSSLFPLKTSRYGVPGWPRTPHHVRFRSGRSLLEVPVAIGGLGGVPVPVAGGGYFRLLPTAVLDRLIKGVLAEGRPVVLYCHPYEWNPREMDEYRGRVKPMLAFTQSLGRGAFIRRMRHLFSTFAFGRFDQVIAPWSGAGSA